MSEEIELLKRSLADARSQIEIDAAAIFDLTGVVKDLTKSNEQMMISKGKLEELNTLYKKLVAEQKEKIEGLETSFKSLTGEVYHLRSQQKPKTEFEKLFEEMTKPDASNRTVADKYELMKCLVLSQIANELCNIRRVMIAGSTGPVPGDLV